MVCKQTWRKVVDYYIADLRRPDEKGTKCGRPRKESEREIGYGKRHSVGMGNKASTPTDSSNSDNNTGIATRYSNISPTEVETPRRSSWLPRPTPPANNTLSPSRHRRGRSASATPRAMSGGSGGGREYEIDEEMQGAERPAQEMSWYQMAKAGYQELVNAIIRPPRANYGVRNLGPVEFEFVGKAFRRTDFQLRNERGQTLECSHWHSNGWRVSERAPCIVYMHGNSSARLEAIPQLTLALSLGASLVAFDFSGSGLSEGDYVSLGYYEKDDVKAVIDHLRRSGTVGAIALWGRSMGAATALLHADRDMSIAALVLDSAFADLTQLAEEMVERGRQAGLTVPSIVVKMVMRMIRGTVLKTAGFNVRDLCPIAHADRTFIPALFVAGRGDDFIKPHHSQQIHDLYAGDKNIVLVDGDHNSPRPSFLFDSVYIFLQNYLQVPLEWGLDRSNVPMGYPPWYFSSAAQYAEHGNMAPELSDYVEWDPSIASGAQGAEARGEAGRAGGGPEGLGTTPATQQEFQAALFHMLAQERNATDSQDNNRSEESAESGAGTRARTAGLPVDTARQRLSVSKDQRPPRQLATDSFGNGNHFGLDRGPHDPHGQVVGPEPMHQEGAVTVAVSPAKPTVVVGPSPLDTEYFTPTAVERPALAPFSVSDTSSQAASPDQMRRFVIKNTGGRVAGAEAASGDWLSVVSDVSEEGLPSENDAKGMARDGVAASDDVMLISCHSGVCVGGDGRESSSQSGKKQGPSCSGAGCVEPSSAPLGQTVVLKGEESLGLKNGGTQQMNGNRDGRIFRSLGGSDRGGGKGERDRKGVGGWKDRIFRDFGSEREAVAAVAGREQGEHRAREGRPSSERKSRIFRDARLSASASGGATAATARQRGGGEGRGGGGGGGMFYDAAGNQLGVAKANVFSDRPGGAGGGNADDEAAVRSGSGGGGVAAAGAAAAGGSPSTAVPNGGRDAAGGGVLSDRGGARGQGPYGIGVDAQGKAVGSCGYSGGGNGSSGVTGLPMDVPLPIGDDGLSSILLADGEWSCSRCTLINVPADRECIACGGER